jgi:hypothetical protein
MFKANTIFTNNVLNKNSVITNSSPSIEVPKNKKMYPGIDIYAKLASYVTTIQTLLDEFSKGNFYVVANTLTRTFYDEISMKLLGLAESSKNYPNYEILRITYTSAIEGLYQAIMQYSLMVDMNAKLDNCADCEAILNDPAKLLEYIEMLKRRSGLFEDVYVEVPKATLKPQYTEYIKRHGFPQGGVFEMDKLAAVLNDLNIQIQ